MASVQTHITIDAPAEDVWNTVRDFGAIDQYVEAIENVETQGTGVGMTRMLTLQDGAQIKERLEALDDEAHTLRYTIVEGPLPVQEYVSTMTVQSTGTRQCKATWNCTFEPDGAPADAVEADLEGLYTAGLEGLHRLHAA